MKPMSRRSFALIAGVGALSACSSGDPFAQPSASGSATAMPTLVVGSQQYYSNEIVAELYAQILEGAGYTVTRQFQIGQREVYLPELESGKIDVMPEYSGNLLQYYDKSTTAKTPSEISAALGKALPSGLRVLKEASASDQDSYTTTKALADQYNLKSIADLASVPAPVKIAANSEFQTRPYGPDGVKAAYGVDVTLVPVEDSGGPLTVKALTDGTVQVADIYTADPVIATQGLVILDDPKSLILPQNVIPVVSQKINDAAAAAIDKVNAKLTAAELQKMNLASTADKLKSSVIAKTWLNEMNLT